ncbi:hypothetical protein WR25_14267 [Diploscapter pachys]|uniref:Uncharacterized protein n=1 Tax=Diploscapter pachys TaxID=2018661 RepID=A0A2A2KD78_9BILA|nr:hypothetical protein WR25_14267 [Diploscapter pachys]
MFPRQSCRQALLWTSLSIEALFFFTWRIFPELLGTLRTVSWEMWKPRTSRAWRSDEVEEQARVPHELPDTTRLLVNELDHDTERAAHPAGDFSNGEFGVMVDPDDGFFGVGQPRLSLHPEEKHNRTVKS